MIPTSKFHGCVLIVLVLVGCSGEPDLGPLATVTGTLTLDGNPLPPGTKVLFMDRERGSTAVSITDTDGRFQMRSLSKSRGEANDFPVGRYDVMLQPSDENYLSDDEITAEQALEGVAPGVQGKLPFPKKYQSFTTSGLTYNVVEGENDFSIKISSDP